MTTATIHQLQHPGRHSGVRRITADIANVGLVSCLGSIELRSAENSPQALYKSPWPAIVLARWISITRLTGNFLLPTDDRTSGEWSVSRNQGQGRTVIYDSVIRDIYGTEKVRRTLNIKMPNWKKPMPNSTVLSTVLHELRAHSLPC